MKMAEMKIQKDAFNGTSNHSFVHCYFVIKPGWLKPKERANRMLALAKIILFPYQFYCQLI